MGGPIRGWGSAASGGGLDVPLNRSVTPSASAPAKTGWVIGKDVSHYRIVEIR